MTENIKQDSPCLTGQKQGEQEYKIDNKHPPKKYQFKKGQSGNPDGKPKGSISITGLIKQKLAELRKFKTDDGKEIKIAIIDVIVEKIIRLAIKGDWKAIEKIWQYMDGMPKSSVELDATINLKKSLAELLIEASKGKSEETQK